MKVLKCFFLLLFVQDSDDQESSPLPSPVSKFPRERFPSPPPSARPRSSTVGALPDINTVRDYISRHSNLPDKKDEESELKKSATPLKTM